MCSYVHLCVPIYMYIHTCRAKHVLMEPHVQTDVGLAADLAGLLSASVSGAWMTNGGPGTIPSRVRAGVEHRDRPPAWTRTYPRLVQAGLGYSPVPADSGRSSKPRGLAGADGLDATALEHGGSAGPHIGSCLWLGVLRVQERVSSLRPWGFQLPLPPPPALGLSCSLPHLGRGHCPAPPHSSG